MPRKEVLYERESGARDEWLRPGRRLPVNDKIQEDDAESGLGRLQLLRFLPFLVILEVLLKAKGPEISLSVNQRQPYTHVLK